MKPKTINQYEIISRLGEGSGGIVYYANDTRLMRPVVLKALRRGKASSGEMREIVLAEARLASAIEHPNVCSIYEVNEFEGQAFIVMQYVSGQTLDNLIEAGGLNLQIALSIAIQIADGLSAAHKLGILHRDLKPANIIISDAGLVKILDFGLAKRKAAEELRVKAGARRAGKPSASARVGTVAYMAPEQFVTGRSSEQSDIFAFGVLLYEMLTGAHPFLEPGVAQTQVARAIQYSEPRPLSERRPELSPEFGGVILKAMAKNPSGRFDSAAEIREALKTVMKTVSVEAGLISGESSAPLSVVGVEPYKIEPYKIEHARKAGLLSTLAERFLGADADVAPEQSIAVLPFTNLGSEPVAPFYGFALADAIATRLARLPSLVVRPSSVATSVAGSSTDLLEMGKRLQARHVLRGSFSQSDAGFSLNWQLLDAGSSAVRAGGQMTVESLDLVAIQNEICDEVIAAIKGENHLQPSRPASPGHPSAEDYLQARALLSNFMMRSSSRNDLDEARSKFRVVLARDPEFAPAHSGLGLTHLQYARKGLGDLSNLIDAEKCFDRALEYDPELVEANLYRVYTLLARGEKESARHGVRYLLETASDHFEVHIVAGVIFRLDGLYEPALEEFSAALGLNPAGATMVYNQRARIYHYRGQLEQALDETAKGLVLDPKHPLLRTTLGYLQFRQGDLRQAIQTLESVLEESPYLPLAYPVLGMCYVMKGLSNGNESLITEEIRAAAEADSEMAYRLATYFAVAGERDESLSWLRKAIYLGNENYPWFAGNPVWEKLRDDNDLANVLSNLKKSFQTNMRRWKQLLPDRATQINAATGAI